jgi:hypothetical protein
MALQMVPKWGQLCQMTTNYTKCPKNVPNGRKMHQLAINVPNGRKMYQSFPFQGPPKYTKIGIFVTIWQPRTQPV